jgi:hypothetical protein
VIYGRAVLRRGHDWGGAATPPYREGHGISELAKNLVALGCPAEKSAEMAAQLDKRARQLTAQKAAVTTMPCSIC